MPRVFDVEYHILEKLVNIKWSSQRSKLKSPVFIKRTHHIKCILLAIEHTFPVTTAGHQHHHVYQSLSGNHHRHPLHMYGVVSSISDKDKRYRAIRIHVILCLAILSALKINVFLVKAI